jgi:RNA polymerase sigma-70 factor (ECF subfamily)
LALFPILLSIENEMAQVVPRIPNDSQSGSTSLIQRLKAQDAQAWQRLLDLYVPLVFSWCRRAEMRSQDSADVVQEVFRAVYRGIADFRYERPEDTFRGWLRTIARNKIQDHFRRRAKQPIARGGTDAQQRLLEVAESESADAPNSRPLAGLMHRALDLVRNEFENHTWQAFWLMSVENRSSSEVAQQLGMTVGAVRQAKYKVLRRLRQELGDTE